MCLGRSVADFMLAETASLLFILTPSSLLLIDLVVIVRDNARYAGTWKAVLLV